MENNLKVAHRGSGEVEDHEEISSELYEILEMLPKPEASMKLSRAQKKWWVWFGLEFIKTNQVSKVDLMHLQKASFWMDARCQAYKAVNEKGYEGGLIQTFNKGATNISGHVSIIEKADKHLDEVSAHFGLSIKDRSKLKVKESPVTNQLSLFEKIQQALHG